MQLEFDHRTFERLVKLYLLGLLGSVIAIVFEALSPTWTAFAEEFDFLVASYFSPPSEAWQTVTVALALPAMIWHIVSAVGLLWYKRWARFGFWASLLASTVAGLLMVGFTPIYQGPWSGLLTWLAAMLFGAILLLAYSGGHGGRWFMKPIDQLKETF